MGTRSLTIILGDDSEELATIYRHWDGYPSSHGRDLKNWFADHEIVNGLPVGQDTSKMINGLGRLAAKVITKLDENGHDPRVLKTGEREIGEEYIYVLSCHGEQWKFESRIGPIHLQVYAGPITAFGFGDENCTTPIYNGLLSRFDPDLEEQDQ